MLKGNIIGEKQNMDNREGKSQITLEMNQLCKDIER